MSAFSPTQSNALAASELDRRFRRDLMAYFFNRIGDRTEAEDLTQLTFLRLLGADRRDIENPRAFVFRIAANLLQDRLRERHRRSLRQTVSLDDANVVVFPADGVTPERILLSRDALARALSALGDLSETTRDIFMQFRFENLKQREIAVRMGMSQAAVEKHVLRATLHLLQTQGEAHDGAG